MRGKKIDTGAKQANYPLASKQKTGFQAQELAPRQAQVPASKCKSWFSNARAGWKQEVPSFENEFDATIMEEP